MLSDMNSVVLFDLMNASFFNFLSVSMIPVCLIYKIWMRILFLM